MPALAVPQAKEKRRFRGFYKQRERRQYQVSHRLTKRKRGGASAAHRYCRIDFGNIY